MKILREDIDYKKIVTPILQNVEQIDAQQFITTIQNIIETNTQNGWWDQTILLPDYDQNLFLSAKRPLTTTEQRRLKERRKQERDRKTQRKLEQEQKERDIYEKLKRKYEP